MGAKKILIIDDEVSFGRLVKLNLELIGNFAVSTAISGEKGIKLAKEVKPDLILLDILMPGIDGLETLKILKKDKDTGNIPVIMLTAKINEVTKSQVAESGANGYISKPIEAMDLKNKIEETFKKKSR